MWGMLILFGIYLKFKLNWATYILPMTLSK